MPMNICSSLDGHVDLFDIVFTSPRNARSEVAPNSRSALKIRGTRIAKFQAK